MHDSAIDADQAITIEVTALAFGQRVTVTTNAIDDTGLKCCSAVQRAARLDAGRQGHSERGHPGGRHQRPVLEPASRIWMCPSVNQCGGFAGLSFWKG